jgi:O-acetyl-ADP-ribose deacetylase (regulator of RNase III)
VHAVGPVWYGGNRGEVGSLEQCYRQVFELALQHRVTTIAFPAISTGAYGFPKERAAAIAVAAMREYEPRFAQIVACCFSEEDAAIYRAVVACSE